MALLEIRQLGKTFRQLARREVCAVRDLSLSIEEGTLTVLTGPSGSGKTTLLSLLGALDRPTTGQVNFEGRDLTDCSEAELTRVRQRIGFVFQDFALLPRLSAIECITYPLIPRGVAPATRNELADQLLERLGISHCRDSPAGQLSGGERQRVAVARALIVSPRLFLADEPTSNLDPESQELLISILVELHKAGTTVVLATHDPRLLALATNVVELRQGCVESVSSDLRPSATRTLRSHTMNVLSDYIPQTVNQGKWLTAYTMNELKARTTDLRIVLPICSLGTPFEELTSLGEFVLPPLYHDALNEELKGEILEQILRCFPTFEGSPIEYDCSATVEVVELPPTRKPAPSKPRILSFSVDTAVEQHGPHLPLATDTIQSYLVLGRLAEEIDGFLVGPPVEYGHLTWGLPFGMSIDITPPLLTRYVTGFANAMQDWVQPEAMYVVDVHGSIVHRTAIVDGLKASSVERFAFRWLYDPIVEFAGDRGDQHAGGVETAMVELASPDLIDRRWWPARIDELAAQQMDLETAVKLTPDLTRFIEHVESHSLNGIVGDVHNYYNVDAAMMLARMLELTRADLKKLAGV